MTYWICFARSRKICNLSRSEEEDDDIQKTKKIPKKKMPLEISQVENDNPAIAPPKKSNKNLRDTQKKPAPSSQRGTRSQQGRLASFSSLSDVGDDDPIDSYHNRYNRGYDMDEEEDDDEPRFKYSTAELADQGCRSTRCCLIAAGIFFILIAIGVSILMAKYIPKNRLLLDTHAMKQLRGTQIQHQ